MSNDRTGLIETPSAQQRIVGRLDGAEPGPTLLATCLLHGNERAGLHAAERLLEGARALVPHMRGRLVVLAGNLAALEKDQRFVDRDLNRAWTPERIARLMQEGTPDEDVEAGQQRALIDEVGQAIEGSEGPVYFLDLHTSSADGPPFLTVGDTLRNRKFAEQFPLPLILGLEEQIDGSMLEYLNNHGFITMGVEAGRHDCPESIDRHEAVLWLALAAVGLLSAEQIPNLEQHRRVLREASRGVPRIVEVRHRHAIGPDDGFEMEAGYRNFRPVSKREVLARDHHGLVLAPEDGLILLPLYQGQGDDGFFITREVRPFWLTVSAVLRRLRAGALMRLLPGVRRHPSIVGALRTNTRIARFYPLEVFHLLGFRKLRRRGAVLTVSRRKFDLRPPERIEFP